MIDFKGKAVKTLNDIYFKPCSCKSCINVQSQYSFLSAHFLKKGIGNEVDRPGVLLCHAYVIKRELT